MIKYRPDIDGLRAVAVILVLLFHLGLGVPGGYVGVDVFFVISGFLITGIINRQMEQGTFSFLDFYGRRARRILPALFVVLLATSIAATIILLPSDLVRYGKSLISALLSVSNFWFWSQGGYFGTISEMAPLLHTWSLGVEEQFYIFLPLVLLLLYRWTPHKVRLLLVIAGLGSFLAAAVFVRTRTPEVFYFSPFRAWELLLGSVLAIGKLPVADDRRHGQWLAVLGLLMIIVPAMTFTSETLFPGPAAALPCIGTALILWASSSSSSPVTRLLSARPMVFIGLISYSLYLWHWPLLVLAKHVLGEDLALPVRLGLGVLSFLLAVLSWKFVETPFRTRTRIGSRQMAMATSSAVAILAAVSAIIWSSQGMPGRFPAEIVALDQARARDVLRAECIDYLRGIDVNSACKLGASGRATVLVWGDSYAHAMLPAFDAALKDMNLSGLFVAESGCPPLPSATVSFKGRDNWRCREFNQQVLKLLSTTKSIDTVLLSGAWDAYTVEKSGYALRVKSRFSSEESLEQGVEDLVTTLRRTSAVKQVVFVGQVPSYDWNVPCRMLLDRLNNRPSSSMTQSAWLSRSAASRGAISTIVRSGSISFIDSSEYFCSTGVCRYADETGQPFYWDNGHINQRGANYMAPALEISLRSILLPGTSSSMRAAP